MDVSTTQDSADGRIGSALVEEGVNSISSLSTSTVVPDPPKILSPTPKISTRRTISPSG